MATQVQSFITISISFFISLVMLEIEGKYKREIRDEDWWIKDGGRDVETNSIRNQKLY